MNKLKILLWSVIFVVVSGMVISTAVGFYHYNENVKEMSNSTTQVLNMVGG